MDPLTTVSSGSPAASAPEGRPPPRQPYGPDGLLPLDPGHVRAVACHPDDPRDRGRLGELCVHLARGTFKDEKRLRHPFGRGDIWLTRPPSEWPKVLDKKGEVLLQNEVNERLEALVDGRAARDELARCAAGGVLLAPLRSPRYPADVRLVDRPPVLLGVRGRWPLPDTEDALAIVGSRAATAYGRATTLRLAAAASREGFAVVSGLARGIDSHALQAALDEGGWPVAVLGNGLDVVYPKENRRLQQAIAEHGTVISEFPLRQQPDRAFFPRRNRIIAALARAVLVVEAGRRSGALITVKHTMELGRDVLTVPGRIDSDTSRGSNELLNDGAVPVLDVDSLLAALDRPRQAGRGRVPVRPAAERHPLLALLGRRALTPDELADEAQMPLPAVRSGLVALELEGRVERWPGGRFAMARSAGR